MKTKRRTEVGGEEEEMEVSEGGKVNEQARRRQWKRGWPGEGEEEQGEGKVGERPKSRSNSRRSVKEVRRKRRGR